MENFEISAPGSQNQYSASELHPVINFPINGNTVEGSRTPKNSPWKGDDFNQFVYYGKWGWCLFLTPNDLDGIWTHDFYRDRVAL